MFLTLDSFGSGQHSILKNPSKNKERIKVITLDDFRETIKEKINLIKIDTEGSEYKILIGGKKCIESNKPVLIIETHPWYDKKN